MKQLYRVKNALSVLFIVLIIFSFDTPLIAMMTLISAAIHEIGHLVPALLSGKSYLSLPRGDLSGFRIAKKRSITYRDELKILIFGPLFNFLFSLLLFVLGLFFGEYFYLFATISLMTMLSNLLPINGYDGYKIILCLICLSRADAQSGRKILEGISFFLCSLIILLSLYFILRLGVGYWIFAIVLSELLRAIDRYNYERP